MRIQINCDHKWRDWPSLALLKNILEKQYKHKVFVVNRNDRYAAAQLFKPHCIIIPHVNGKAQLEYVKELKNQNIFVIMLPTEGRPIYKELLPYFWGEYTDYNDVDLFFSWSNNITEGILKNKKINQNNIVTTGCSRFDFYQPIFQTLYLTKKQFCEKYKLDPEKPIVTWATQYNYARFVSQNTEWGITDLRNAGVADCFERSGYNVENFPSDQDGERTAAAQAFFKLAKSLPSVNFIIKPHPAEDAGYYQNLIDENELNNVFFIHHEHIWNILAHTTVHLQRHCTTAVEAWFLNKPTIEMEMGDTHPFTWKEMADGSEKAHDYEELFEKVQYYLSNGIIPIEILENRKQYISEWFYKFGTDRTPEIAELINNFLVNKPDLISWPINNQIKYYLSIWFTLNWRTFSLRKPHLIRKEISASDITPDKINNLDRFITQYDISSFENKLKKLNL